MRTRWSPSALQTLAGCRRRFALREAGWTPRLDPMRPPEPHADFGRIWHGAAEVYDRARWVGTSPERATEEAIEFAFDVTWDTERGQPWAGLAADEWRCADGKAASEKTGRPVQCPTSKGWWIGYEGEQCSRCGGPVEMRHVLSAFHPRKNRATLLRAVYDYTQDALPGVAEIAGAPGLETELEFRLAGLDMHCILDRYTTIGETRLAHERKTSSRAPFWDGYMQTFQIRLYPEALRQNGLRCDGVLIEHYQVLRGGTRRSTTIMTPGPDHVVEAAIIGSRLVESAHEGGDSPLHQLPNFAHCVHAAGGRPCEFLPVCRAAPGRRPELLGADFEQACAHVHTERGGAI